MDLLRDALQDHRFCLFANWLAAVVTKALGAFGLADRAMAAADESGETPALPCVPAPAVHDVPSGL